MSHGSQCRDHMPPGLTGTTLADPSLEIGRDSLLLLRWSRHVTPDQPLRRLQSEEGHGCEHRKVAEAMDMLQRSPIQANFNAGESLRNAPG